MTPHLDIILVNWNAGNQLLECLLSIASTRKIGFTLDKVIIVDNASNDGSVDNLTKIGLDFELILIRNKKNKGFAEACNQGADGSKADYILFLNPDTQLFLNSLSVPVDFMQRIENANVGICGIQLVDDKGEVSRTCAHFPMPSTIYWKMLGLDYIFPKIFQSNFMVNWDHGETREVDQVMGAFFFVRRSLFLKLEGFDGRFFVYFEEVDFSLRARQIGWKSLYITDAKAYHKGGGTSEQLKAMRLFYFLRSRILYGYKHFSRFEAIGVMLGSIFLEFLSRLLLSVMHRSTKEISEVFKAYSMLWTTLPKFLIEQIHQNLFWDKE